jgi:predicted NBD/HSP70 family sugar kinase
MLAGRRLFAPITSPAAAAVFTTVLTQGPVSRAEVARRTGLSSAAVTKVARPFIDVGYLEESGASERGASGIGRPASPLAVRADREFFVGVKVTSDELIGVVTDLRSEVRATARRPLAGTGVGQAVTALTELVHELLAADPGFRERTHRIGVAVSGDVDLASGLVRYSPFLRWRDVPLAALAEAATGLAAAVENDVKALTVAERWFGEGRGASSFAVVTVGAGIGCGLVLNGCLVAGARGVAGEIGHVQVMDGGPLCHCGARGCVEAIASTQAILDAAGEPGLTIDAAIDRARAGDEALRAVFARAGRAIGLGLVAMANLVGPDRIVVSGEGLAAYDLFEDELRRTFEIGAFGAAHCPLVIRPRPFSEWARGAAAVAIQTLFTPAQA